MEAICSSEDGGDMFPEASVATQQTTWRHIPEDDTLHNHRCENLKSYISILLFVKIRNLNCTCLWKILYPIVSIVTGFSIHFFLEVAGFM
jgi:hypothetical protein